MGLEDDIHEKRRAMAASAAAAAAWRASGVGRGDPPVTDPPAHLSALVREARGRLKYTKKVFCGTGPDGVVRINEHGKQVKNSFLKQWFIQPYRFVYNAKCADIPVGPQGKDESSLRCWVLPDGRGVFPPMTVDEFRSALVDYLA